MLQTKARTQVPLFQGRARSATGGKPQTVSAPPFGKESTHNGRKGQSGSRLRKVTTGSSFGRERSNFAPEMTNVASHPRPRSVNPFGPPDSIRPSRINDITPSVPSPANTTRVREDFCIDWLMNNRKSSTPDERIFVVSVKAYGLKIATATAARFRWKCQRPLRALRAAMNARGKNYSARGLHGRNRI